MDLNHYSIIDTVTGTVLAAEGCVLVRSEYLTDDVLADERALNKIAKHNGIPLDPDVYA